MKIDPRHQARKLALYKLFSEFFVKENEIPQSLLEEDKNAQTANMELAQNLINGVKEKLEKIDGLISECAPEWPIERIAKIDLAILRISVYELLSGKTSKNVVIDEAVELAKEFGGENSSKFVNGVLGSVVDKIYPAEEKEV